MRIFLTGVACVGKTTIGVKLAGLLDYRFFDLDHEIEDFFGISIERLQNRHLTLYSFRADASRALTHLLAREGSADLVVALPPSGLMGGYWRVVKKYGVDHHCRTPGYAGEYPQENYLLRHRFAPDS